MEKRYYTLLLVIFWGILAGCALLYATFSALGLIGMMGDLPPTALMVGAYVVMLVTIAAIPFILKNVRLQQRRIVLLGAVLELDTLSYVLLGDKSLGYLALITLVAMIFVYPKKALNDEDQKAVEALEKQNSNL